MTSSMRLNGGRILTAGQAAPQVGFKAKVLSQGAALGNFEPLAQTLNTLMTQGAWETLGKPGNRSPTLVVEIEGDTADGLNAGEVWLSGLMGPGKLEWLPPKQTVWTVFDVIWSYIERAEDADWDHLENTWIRRYRIVLKALPHARSQNITVTPAEAPIVYDAQIDSGASTTGWSAKQVLEDPASTTTPTVSVASGMVGSSGFVGGDSGTSQAYLRRTGTIDLTPGRYLQVDWIQNYGHPPSLLLSTGQSILPTITAAGSGGVQQGFYRIPTGVTSLAWIEMQWIINNQAQSTHRVDQIRLLGDLSMVTSRQKLRTIVPGGSAPAQGSLHVSHPTAGLGNTILYTGPIGRPSPALMQYRTTSFTPVTDSAAINGQRIPIDSADLVLTVPDPQLPTRGGAALWAKLRVDTAPATVTWTLTPTIGGSAVGQVQTRAITVPVGTIVLVPLGLVTLGAVTGPAGAGVVTLRRTAGSGSVSVDEVWAFSVDEDSALTIVDAGAGTPASGGPSNHMWINAPTPDVPAGEVLVGTGPTDAHWPSTIQAGPAVHRFPWPGVSVLTVTCSATDASTDFTHFKRWTHHAAQNS